MSIPPVTPELIARIDRFSVLFNAARMEALARLTGNPFRVDVQYFGDGAGVACKSLHPLLRGKNRLYGFRAQDMSLLPDLLAFFHRDTLRCTVFVPHAEMTQEVFSRLAEAGLWSRGNGLVPAIVPDGRADDIAPPTSPNIQIRVSTQDEKERYLNLFQQAFGQREERAEEYREFQWAEDSLQGGARYLAEWQGKAAGMASFPIIEGVGFFGTAGILPEYRGRGMQTALIRHRIAQAGGLSCDLILAGGSPGTTTYRNFERTGLRLLPTGTAWSERQG